MISLKQILLKNNSIANYKYSDVNNSKNICETQQPQLFSHTIYRVPTDGELMELGKFNLSGYDVLNGIKYIIIGRGVKDSTNSRMILDTMKRITELFPDNESYKVAYDHAKTLFGNRPPININKLKQYANAIKICCNGEYGQVFYNEKENKIFICLGDSSPFDYESLLYYMRDAIKDTMWVDDSQINITIENESYPNNESKNWKLYDSRTNEFMIYNTE